MKFLILPILLLMTSVSYSGDFRNTSWGMAKEQVKETENIDIVEENTNSISYIETIVNYPALLVYKFQDNKLIWGSYSFKQINDKDDEYLEDFINFEEAISSKYGEGKKLDRWNNSNSKFKNNLAGAVRAGDLIMWRSWETPTTIIKLIMYGYNNNFNIDTFYFSKKYKDKAEKHIQDIQNDNF
ncbi:MAG: hypothetical protein ACR2NW_03370 [Thermodesulfobacteriota bacterium]